ncbi:Ig-like domain-containing protein [Paludibacter sp. 221]|uniref:Ig-like domain-containing protein n=1 Tax=Paludibacter sp. 221 TaxID=2302939 RepID=UPI0013D4FCFF|nr:Ig-like domain-containing protein [Paludibacter sp. 221]NDV46555.1 Ig-like domain-containing protein [Paludibacter sp. 221]
MNKISIYFLLIILAIFSSCEQEVAEIVLNESNGYLGIGETLQLTYKIKAPEDNDSPTIWSSTNDAIAKVSENGLVTAISEGSVIITATAGKETASCEISIVTYRFSGASIYDYSTITEKANNFFLQFTYKSPATVASKEVYLDFDMILPNNATGLNNGELYKASENETLLTFLPGKFENDKHIGSILITKENDTKNTIYITDGEFTVSKPDKYFILGELKAMINGSESAISFVYDGSISVKEISKGNDEEEEDTTKE